jgi:hypothetical protein
MYRMIEPKRSLLQQIGIALCALPFAALVTVVFRTSSQFRPILGIVFVVAYCVSYLVLYWVFFTRPEYLRKKLPISSKELQRRTKEFYENLPR